MSQCCSLQFLQLLVIRTREPYVEGVLMMTTNPTDITLHQAEGVVDACVRRAEDLDLKMNAAVVDAGAHLIAFNRMDGAWLGSIDIYIKKARLAGYFELEC